MNRDDFLNRLSRIRVWKSGGRRAPHKPLLMLYSLGRIQQGKSRLVPYSEIATDLTSLLRRFGPPAKTFHPEAPFEYLPNDGLWEIPGVEAVSKSRSGSLLQSSLIHHNIRGGLPVADYEMLLEDDGLTEEAADLLLAAHFPQSMHGDIREAVGLSDIGIWRVAEAATEVYSKERDPNFRCEVLRAYEYRCSVCEYDLRLGDELIGLEAAHIRWHSAGGPDEIQNGLALCGFHHKAFDRGAWGLQPEARGYQIKISSEVHGRSRALRWLRDYNGKGLQFPQKKDWLPAAEFVRWHTREVFRPPAA